MEFLEVDFTRTLEHLGKLAIAFFVALPIGWNRERANNHRLGLRTFPLVSIASCGYVLVAQSVVSDDAMARIIQGLITGVGFLGGGAIVQRGLDVHGAATAASIWSTAAIGAAVAFTRYEIAIALSLATFASLFGLTPLKDHVENVDELEDSDEETIK